MRQTIVVALFVLGGVACAGRLAAPHAAEPLGELDPKVIAATSGVQPAVAKDGGVKISWPRADIGVTVDGQRLPPAAGLTSWATFAAAPGGAMVMGDTVVLEDEVDAAMDAAFAAGLDVTALHNHFFYDEPNVFFMHIGGHGHAQGLAAGVKAVWDAVKSVRARNATPARGFAGVVPAEGSMDRRAIEEIVGHPAPLTGGVVKVTIARRAHMHGVAVGESMGLTTWAAFTGSDEAASVAGDFIMTAGEVQPVLRALRRSGIHVVALHNHMVGEQPSLYFTHFWGKGAAVDLARAIRNALDAQARA